MILSNSIITNSLNDRFTELLSNCKHIKVSSPFFTNNDILNEIIKRNVQMELIVRLCAATSIDTLLRIIDNENIQIRFFVEETFHSKIYIFDDGNCIIGSSNFTNGGLFRNKEINVEITKSNNDFNTVLEVYDSYWNDAKKLDKELLQHIKECTQECTVNPVNIDDLIIKSVETFKAKRKSRVFSDEHKRRISESNKGKKKGERSLEHRIAMAEGATKALSKSVVCLNTNTRYGSLKNASETLYGTVSGYGYISDVCHGKYEQYKGNVWRFEDDFQRMSEEEIEEALECLKQKNAKHLTRRIQRKLMYKGIIYEKAEELGKLLLEEGYLKNMKSTNRPGQVLSALISQAEKSNSSFIRLHNKSQDTYNHIFFADYEIVSEKGIKMSDLPIARELSEIESYYSDILDFNIGDLTVSDLILSKKNKFYKLDGNYYSSMSYIKDTLSIDEVLSKAETLSLYQFNKHDFLWEVKDGEIMNGLKEQYFLKGQCVFKKKNDYLEIHLQTLTKNDVLIELGLQF